MAYTKKQLEEQALKAIKKHKLVFIEDVVCYITCSKSTFYNKRLHLNKNIQKALGTSKNKNLKSAKTRVCKRVLAEQIRNRGSGYIYLVRCKGFEFYKIGISKTSVEHRLSSLQTGCPFDLEVLHIGYANSYKSIEVLLHNKYREYNHRGEWFELNDNQVKDVITDITNLCTSKQPVNINVTFGDQINIF